MVRNENKLKILLEDYVRSSHRKRTLSRASYLHENISHIRSVVRKSYSHHRLYTAHVRSNDGLYFERIQVADVALRTFVGKGENSLAMQNNHPGRPMKSHSRIPADGNSDIARNNVLVDEQ